MATQDFPLLPIRFRDLIPHPRNEAIYGEKHDSGELSASIAEFGILHDPLVHRRESGEIFILSGHRRIEAALGAGKTLDDTILCRVMAGLTEHEERAILVHANKQRAKTKREILAERHELIAIGRELGLKQVSRTRAFSVETPRNLQEAAALAGICLKSVRRISSIYEQIRQCPCKLKQKEAQEAFDLGKYRAAARMLAIFWNTHSDLAHAKLIRSRKLVQKTKIQLKGELHRELQAKTLEIAMLKEKVATLEKQLANSLVRF